MKIVLIKSLLVFSFFGLVGCSFTTAKLEFNRAERAIKDKDYKTAIKYYKRVIKRQPETKISITAAKKGAEVAKIDAEDFNSAISFLKYLVINATQFTDVKAAQTSIAEIYYSRMSDYKNAIEAYSQLLSLKLSDEERIKARTNIAKSYFYLNNFYQASVEIDSLLQERLSEEEKFQTLIFKANTLMTLKKHSKASDVYKKVIELFPEMSLKENVPISLSSSYEEMEDYKMAISVLEDLKGKYPDQEFLDYKISRLKQRQKNMPGARGRVR